MLENYKSSLLDIISMLFLFDRIYFPNSFWKHYFKVVGFFNWSFNLLKINRFRNFDIVLLENLKIVYLSILKIFKKLFIFLYF